MFNKQEILEYSQFNERLTVSFEFELSSEDNKAIMSINHEGILKRFKTKLIKLITGHINLEKYDKFIDRLLNRLDLVNEDKTLDKILVSNYKDEKRNIIVDQLYLIIWDYFEMNEDEEDYQKQLNERDFVYAEDRVKEHLPNFYERYKDELKYEFDFTVTGSGNIEIIPKLYNFGLIAGLDMLELFFKDFEKQTYWSMNSSSSIHINLGVLERKFTDLEISKIKNMDGDKAYKYLLSFFTSRKDYNILKGAMMIDDRSESPYVYKDIDPDRINSKFTNSIIKTLIKNKKLNLDKLNGTEYLISELDKLIKKHGGKAFGFNFEYLNIKKYIEFRYIGGILSFDIMKEKLLYFCYIMRLMIEKEYQDSEYKSKYQEFINELQKK